MSRFNFAAARKVGFDTETTGVDVKTDRIVTAAIVCRGGDKADFVKTWLINPGVSIAAEATEIHGITNEMVQESGVQPGVALMEISSFLRRAMFFQRPIVAFNLAFDWSILAAELARYEMEPMPEYFGLVDPLVIDKKVDKYRRGKRKLGVTAAHYGVELENWHTADADALAAVAIAEKVFAKYGYLNTYPPEYLYRKQITWRAEQQRGLQAYFRDESKSGEAFDSTAVCDGGWPILNG